MPVTVRCTECQEEFQSPSLLIAHLSRCFSDGQRPLPARQESYASSRTSLSPASSCDSLTSKRQRTTRNSQRTLVNESNPVETTFEQKQSEAAMAPVAHQASISIKEGYRTIVFNKNSPDPPAQVPVFSNVNGYGNPFSPEVLGRTIKQEAPSPEPELNINIESVAGGDAGVDAMRKGTEKSRDELDWLLRHPALGEDQDLDAIPDDVWLSEVKEEPMDEDDFMEAVVEEETDLRSSVDEAHQRDLENSQTIHIEETHAQTSVEDLVSYSKQCFKNKPRKYPCNYCQKAFTSNSQLVIHERRHTGEKPFKCKSCDKRFVDKGDLSKHSLTHNNKRSFKCNECNVSFKLRRNLYLHRTVHTGEKKYQCDICNARFRLPSMLDSHYRIHTGYRPYKCEVCGKTFRVSYTYKIHMRLHTDEKPFQCSEKECDFASRDKPSLVKHMRKHTLERPYSCKDCGKTFATTGALNMHANTHGGERKFQCMECPWSFYTAANLTKHMMRHTGEKNHECAVCGRRFAQKGNLLKHMMYHEEKSYQCGVCEKMFYTREDAKKHENDVHNPVKMYQCVECPKAFSRSEHLKKHAEVHNGVTYKCQFCDKEFKHVSSRYKHEKRFHTEVPCILCKYCPTEFKRFTNYAKHVAKYHPGMDWHCAQCGGTFTSEKAFMDHALHIHGVRSQSLQTGDKKEEDLEKPQEDDDHRIILPDSIKQEPPEIF